ncbi:MAG: YibE/F family protein [Anaerovoracaceae bacterium]
MKDKTFILKLILTIILVVAGFAAVYNDCGIYNRPIMKVNSVETVGSLQTITGVMKNGDNKGSQVTVTNKFEKSLVYDNKYHKGNLLFLSEDTSSKDVQISGQKRDHLVALIFLILFGALFLVGGIQGTYTILGLVINVSIFFFLLTFYGKGTNILLISVALSTIFTLLVLVLINGFNRKTLVAAAATLSSVVVIGLISGAVIFLGPDIDYDFVEFMPEPFTQKNAHLMFLSEIIIGSLGIIMDIAVTITATAFELIRQDPRISNRQLMSSARTVSDDITGTMINVVFFTNIAAIIPIFILCLRNDFHFMTVINNNIGFEIVRFLTGATSIVLTIPITLLAVMVFHKNDGNSDADGEAGPKSMATSKGGES